MSGACEEECEKVSEGDRGLGLAQCAYMVVAEVVA